MSFFIYKILTAKGELERRAGSFADMGELLDSLEPKGEALAAVRSYPDFFHEIHQRIEGRLTPQQVIELCHFIATYVASGLDVNSALRDLGANNKRIMQRLIDKLQADILEGFSLSEAFANSGMIPELVIRMTRIGEESGELERMLRDAARHIERTESIKSAVKRALIYPGFTLTAMLGGFIFWMAYVVPQLVELFITMEVALPLPTRMLIAISDVVANHWLLIVIIVALLPIALKLARRHPKVRIGGDRMLWRAPIIGNMIRLAQESFYFQYLALMYRSGVVITTALDTVRDAVSNIFFQQKLAPIQRSLRDGYSLAESFGRPELFDPLVLRMIGIGEQTGQLDMQLTRLADDYFDRLQAQVEIIGKTLEPVILGVVGIFFAFFVIALLGPLYDLVSGVGV